MRGCQGRSASVELSTTERESTIGANHRSARRLQGRGDVRVTADMLAVAVRQQRQPRSSFVGPFLHKNVSVSAVKHPFHTSPPSSLQCSCPSTTRVYRCSGVSAASTDVVPVIKCSTPRHCSSPKEVLLRLSGQVT